MIVLVLYVYLRPLVKQDKSTNPCGKGKKSCLTFLWCKQSKQKNRKLPCVVWIVGVGCIWELGDGETLLTCVVGVVVVEALSNKRKQNLSNEIPLATIMILIMGRHNGKVRLTSIFERNFEVVFFIFLLRNTFCSFWVIIALPCLPRGPWVEYLCFKFWFVYHKFLVPPWLAESFACLPHNRHAHIENQISLANHTEVYSNKDSASQVDHKFSPEGVVDTAWEIVGLELGFERIGAGKENEGEQWKDKTVNL